MKGVPPGSASTMGWIRELGLMELVTHGAGLCHSQRPEWWSGKEICDRSNWPETHHG